MKKFILVVILALLLTGCSGRMADEKDLNKIKFGDNTALLKETLGEPTFESKKTTDLEKTLQSARDDENDLNPYMSEAYYQISTIEIFMKENHNLTLYQYKFKRDGETFLKNYVTLKDNDENFVAAVFESK